MPFNNETTLSSITVIQFAHVCVVAVSWTFCSSSSWLLTVPHTSPVCWIRFYRSALSERLWKLFCYQFITMLQHSGLFTHIITNLKWTRGFVAIWIILRTLCGVSFSASMVYSNSCWSAGCDVCLRWLRYSLPRKYRYAQVLITRSYDF